MCFRHGKPSSGLVERKHTCHSSWGDRAVAGRNNTSKTSERTEQQKGVKMNLIVVDVHEGRMKTSTVIYHIAERDIKEDDSIYELNLPA